MVARLWWKDFRQFWPIWTLIVALALAAQVLVIWYDGSGFRSAGGLSVLALGWTCLYGYAVAAAAFAGEREAGTLPWLDALALDRRKLWLAKASFAGASTFALGLLLAAVAAYPAQKWPEMTLMQGLLSGSLVLLGVLGSGFFWSSITGNASLAAVLAIATSLLGIPAIERWSSTSRFLYESPWVLGAVALAWAASLSLFVGSQPPGRRRGAGRLRSPIAPRAERSPGAAIDAEVSRPSYTRSAARSLTWQTFREARASFGWLLVIAALIPAVVSFITDAAEPWAVGPLLAALVTGSCVFGNDLRRGSHRMLAHEGVRPSLIWLIRVTTWLAVLVGVLVLAVAVLYLSLFTLGGPRIGPWSGDGGLRLLSFGAIAFCVPVLCGMIFRRTITAGVVAILLWFLCWIPLVGLFVTNLMPPVFLVAVPLAILGVSLAWSGDWLVELPGVGRWLRLAGWCLAFFAATLASYAAVRAFEIPQLDPGSDPRLFGPATLPPIPGGQDAAPLYAKAAASLASMPMDAFKTNAGGAIPLTDTLREWLGKDQEALALIRQANARPECRFVDLEHATLFSGLQGWSVGHGFEGLLLEVSVREQLSRGDLDGAWKDIEACFRMARHRMSDVPVSVAAGGLHEERRALRLAMEWAADGRQTAEKLRSARAAFEAIPRPDSAEPLRVEARLLRNTEAMPRSELREQLLQRYAEPKKQIETADQLRIDVMTTPWEIARFGRAGRMVLAWGIEQAGLEPWSAVRGGGFQIVSTGWQLAPRLVEWILQTTPLLRQFLPAVEFYTQQCDRNEVGRRALVQVLALRAWQVAHDGKLPPDLEVLVSDGELDRLPTDPFRPNRPFGYVASTGQSLLPLNDDGILWRESKLFPRLRPVPSGFLLYSFGPDGDDDHAMQNDNPQTGGDIIFPLIGSANDKAEKLDRKGN